MSYTYVRAHNKFRGWIRDDFPADIVADMVADFEVWVQRSSVRLIKDDGKSQVVQLIVTDGTGKRWDVVIKRVKYVWFIRRLGFLLSASPAIRSFKGAFLFQEKNIPTAAPLAAVEPRRWHGLGTSYFLAETVGDARNLSAVLSDLEEKGSGSATLRRRRLLRQLSAFFWRVHGSGVYHRDLKDANILVRDKEGEQFEFVLIDLDGVRRSRTFSWRKRLKNLIQVCRSRRLSYRDKILFLDDYLRRCGVSKRKMKTLARRVVRLTTMPRLSAYPGRNPLAKKRSS